MTGFYFSTVLFLSVLKSELSALEKQDITKRISKRYEIPKHLDSPSVF